MPTGWSCGRRRSQLAPYRHGATEDDIRHVPRNLVTVTADPGDEDVTLFLGPDRAANMIEVAVLAADDGPSIIHAMAAYGRLFQTQRVTVARTVAEKERVDDEIAARADRHSWAAVAAMLGVSKQTAQARYGR